MKSLKYIISILSAFLVLSISVFAADGEVTKVISFVGSNHEMTYSMGSSYTRVESDFYGYPDGAMFKAGFTGTVPAVSSYLLRTWRNGLNYFGPFTSGVLYTITVDFSFSDSIPLATTTTTNPVRIRLGNSVGNYTALINPSPGSWSSGASGGQVSFNFALSDDLVNLTPFDFHTLLFYIYPKKITSSVNPTFAFHNFKISYTPTTQSVLDELERQGNLITGVINEQTGEITGKIDEATDEILHGYDAPDFSGNQSTIDDYTNKEQELIDGTADGKNEMESINNNALSAITSHVGAFVSVAQMLNDYINGHWFTNGLFTISASVGLLAVLLGVSVFAIGRISQRSHRAGTSKRGRKG